MKNVSLYNVLIMLVLSCFVLAISSCQSSNSDRKQIVLHNAQDLKSDTAVENNWLPPMQVPFRPLDNHFVRSDVYDSGEFKLESQAQFDGVFSPAATMGSHGRPSQINFDSEFVIAYIGSESKHMTNIKSVSLQRLADGGLLYTYKIEEGAVQTFTIRPFVAVVVEKQFDGKVIFRQEE